MRSALRPRVPRNRAGRRRDLQKIRRQAVRRMWPLLMGIGVVMFCYCLLR